MPLVGDTLKLLTTLIQGRNECAACKDFTALGTNGIAAYFKMKHGAPSPAAHREAGFSQCGLTRMVRCMYFKPMGPTRKS